MLLLLAAPLRAGDLAEQLRAVIDGPEYQHARWGILIADLKDDSLVFSRNAERMFAPASVTKLFSCAAALAALGPQHRFETPVYAVGKLADGELRGNLVLVAQGDLTFGGRDTPSGKTAYRDNDHTYADGTSTETQLTDTNPLAALESLAKQVRAAGITNVLGDVLIDDRLFAASEGSGSGPRVVSPMIVNDNLIDLIVEPGAAAGEPATVRVRPESAFFRLDFEIETVHGDGPKALREKPAFTVLNGEPQNYVLRGRIPAGSKPIVGIVPIRRPADFARTLFIEALRREGVRVAAPLVRQQAWSELPPETEYIRSERVARYVSRPLAEAVEVTLKVSHNLYASTLPQLVAVKRGGGKTLADGLKAQGEVLREIGIDLDQVSFAGGAGGANADHVTPRVTVDLLRAMAKRPEWEAYRSGMPVLGVDGTLASVSRDTPAAGHVFAKTGTLGWTDLVNDRTFLTSKALAGVMTTKSGRELAFAMFVNDVPLPKGARSNREGRVLGRLCEIIYDTLP